MKIIFQLCAVLMFSYLFVPKLLTLLFLLHPSLSTHLEILIPLSLIPVLTSYIHEFRGLPFLLLPGRHHSKIPKFFERAFLYLIIIIIIIIIITIIQTLRTRSVKPIPDFTLTYLQMEMLYKLSNLGSIDDISQNLSLESLKGQLLVRFLTEKIESGP